MKKVFILFQATGQHNDKIVSIHANKRSALLARESAEESLIGLCKAKDITDYYITERYVIE